MSLRKIFGFLKRKHTAEILDKWDEKAYKWHVAHNPEKYKPKTQDIKATPVNLGKKPSSEEIQKAEKIYLSWNSYSSEQKQRVEAIAQKNVPLGSECFLCGSTENLCRHHQDYSKPLEIITVCTHHHNSVHRRNEYYFSVPITNALLFIIEIERKLGHFE